MIRLHCVDVLNDDVAFRCSAARDGRGSLIEIEMYSLGHMSGDPLPLVEHFHQQQTFQI